ncbi:transcription initiation factor TFIID subunit 7-like [Rattus norvegicus]|uniref:TATA-box binding protein associated factor 7-like n=1 Tax=Rattus norvegicus TaxID=10116 RepID=D4AC01_RAT|nr:transcription initiation factor TFIID subunit 7-like [Rattus norvegicus]|eukprot:NP_001129349.1 transcription initiation factor TFIID subunit 7-like [Rattus norvegicus]
MERGEEAPVEGAPTERAPAEGALAEAALPKAALAEAGAPDISEAPSTHAPTSEETGPKEPQVPISLGAESACDTSDTGGARGLVIPVPSRAEPHGTRPSTARGRALQKAMRAMSLRHEESHEIEEQFILRLPPVTDGHHAVVQVENVSLPAKLVNLPCVIGSLKTVDRKTFYQTADISQMLVCSPEGEPHSSPEEPVISTGPTVTGHIEGKAEKKKYNWKHGITPPLKNVRKKRFRKTTKKLPDVKQMDEINFSEYTQSPSVEKEVKRLLCSDAEAVSVRWEVVADDDTKEIESQGCISTTSGTPQMGGAGSSEYDVLREMMGETGSNSNDVEDKNSKIEDEDEDDQEDEDEDDGNEEKEEETDNSEEELEKELQAKFIQSSLHEKEQDYTSIIMEIQKLIHIKEQKLQQIYKKAQRQKDLLRNVENLTLKRHFQNVLEKLNILEKEKCEQIYHLQEQLKCFLKE